MNVTYRAPNPGDVAFVYATWLKNARGQFDRAHMTNTTYYGGEKKRIDRLIEKSHVVIICNSDEEDQIYGWVCYQEIRGLLIVHYAYMKRSFQRMGMMTTLLQKIYPRFRQDEIAVTYLSDLVVPKRTKYRLKYNPYLQEMI